MSDPFRLDRQAIFITGGAKGMGRAVTLRLAEAGAQVVLAARDVAALESVAEDVEEFGVRAEVLPCDVTDPASVTNAIDQAMKAFEPHRWGLVNIAGATGPSGKKLWEHTYDEVQSVFDVNVFGTFLTMKAFLPYMMAAGAGAVVNLGGTFGFKGVRDASAYGATKWALRGFTKSAALEAGPRGVRINMVSPGGVEGPRLKRQLGEEAERQGVDYQTVYARFAAGTALGKMSQDEDVANAVQFLLSDAAANITGQDILVDGGTIV
ncbi:SDR family NAD(P)-dependent oxidoreductase [Bauldia sp.]|uniref:SDR family NAD(P)-dependent oxidoreductase n=1 Tax=Bauldia sp. TaxID=2575872 RepID=UPI003BA9CE1C